MGRARHAPHQPVQLLLRHAAQLRDHPAQAPAGRGVTTIDSASLPWVLNRRYQLRLESIGTLHRVYVNGVLVLEAWDDALSHGRAALLTYRAAAEYDNVIVSPFLTQTIYSASEGTV